MTSRKRRNYKTPFKQWRTNGRFSNFMKNHNPLSEPTTTFAWISSAHKIWENKLSRSWKKYKQRWQMRFGVNCLTFSAVCLPWEEPGRSLLIADPRLRFEEGSVFSLNLAFSERSDNPFTFVTKKWKDDTQKERRKFT